MNVEVWLKKTSQPLTYEAKNTYVKGPFYCILVDKQVYKYPVRDIYRVIEDYNK